jgi:hypothetical protein
LQVPSDEAEQCGTAKAAKASTPRSSSSSRPNNESESSEEFRNITDEYEPVDIEGLEKAEVWVHRPGSDVTGTWEPRKGRPRCQDSKIHRLNDACSDSPRSSVSGSQRSDSSTEEPGNDKTRHRHLSKVKKGLGKLAGAVLNRSSKKVSDDEAPTCVTPHPNIRPVGESRVSVTYVVDQDPGNRKMQKGADDQHSSPEREDLDSPTKRHLRKKTVHIVKHAGGKTAHNLKSMFSRKGSDKSKEECQNDEEDDDRSATKIDAVVAPIPSSAAVDAAEPVADGDDKISAK